MWVDLGGNDLINLLVGDSRNYGMEYCGELEKEGLMKFTGNQWNENWGFDIKALEKMSQGVLLSLYLRGLASRLGKRTV